MYNDFALLLKSSAKPNLCINASKALENHYLDIIDEEEYILPSNLLIIAELIAAYSKREDIYWCLPKYNSYIKKYTVNKHFEYVPSFLDFIDILTCLSESQKYKIYSYILSMKNVF